VTRPFGVVAVIAFLLSGCQLVGSGGPRGGAYPGACADLGFSARRCAAIVDLAIDEAAINKTLVAKIEMLSSAGPAAPGERGAMARIRFTFGDGTSITQDVAGCGGVGRGDEVACTNDPQLMLFGGIDHDIPCAGEAPNGDPTDCATLPTTPDHAAMEAATPLRIVALDIPLGHTGPYEVKVGRASLPNGYLSRREFEVADLRPTTFWITGGIRLDIRPTVAGRPPVGSVYRDAFKGPEPVDVVLVFDVTETSPGAVLRVRELVVQ
jgi:hypothetical protein